MQSNQPLAERMRPKNLEEYIGQEHLVGKNGALRRSIDSGALPSLILWGPPGVGKTTLANLLAQKLNRTFFTLSAVHSGVKDVRETIEKAKSHAFMGTPSPILFIDEIHRFSKSQQDSLLMAVEKGIVTLIGATTENPSFEVISPLLSRSQVYILKPLEEQHLKTILDRALEKDFLLKQANVELKETEALMRISGGDARRLLNALEIVISTLKSEIQDSSIPIVITNNVVLSIIQKNIAIYDKDGEQHYDVISAFIKSVRGSDPNAAVYYLARMIESGEDIEFIARRLIILAAEDIGLANPNALLLANNCFQAIHAIGMPEARIILSETTLYLACSPKSNAAYLAIDEALGYVRETGNLPVPMQLRNAPTNLMKKIGYGKDYKYSHDGPGHFVEQEFMPKEIVGKVFYNPAENQRENEMRAYLKKCWNKKYNY
ncbi:MAG TPA: replication-associated recombination protein A [Bacteroidales bacterium]|nr:replication-associated recombination protein A [Bacteroidales bacterium]